MTARSESVLEPGQTDLSPQAFERLAQYITKELGIKMPEAKLPMVQSRLLRRVRELGLPSLDHYAAYFFDSPNQDEREHFINSVTTNKTDFFREPEHFAFLCGTVLPEFSAGRTAGRRFQVWSAGCSSGEEPYTLAMVLAEYAAGDTAFDFAILATDVSTRVLKVAHEGVYDQAKVLPAPLELRRKYLLRGRGENESLVRVSPRLRAKVSFHSLNFMADSFGIRDAFDAVFFRNVMIYFERSTQEQVINRMAKHMAPGAYLFVGHAESLAGLDIPFRPVRTSVYRKTGGV